MISALIGKPTVDFNKPVDRFGDVSEIRIPDVKGLSIGIAKLELEAAGFHVEVASRPVRSNLPRGTVAFTTPKGGEDAEDGSTVTIFLSNGKGRGRGDSPPIFRPGHGFPNFGGGN